MRDELTVQDGLIFRGERVVIPSSLRQVMKQKVHSSHMGIDSCLRRAREHIYWTGMSAEIKQQIEACETCGKFGMNQPKEPLMPHEVPSRPWEKVGTDIFEHDNKEYLVTVDYYSNFWEFDRLPDTKASTVVLKLKNHFARYGCPDQVVSDNMVHSSPVISLISSHKRGSLSTTPAAQATARRTAKQSPL